ncbi:MAG TPA: OmpH family outer membrane protein [Candidatus Aquilonibacter sp.]|nr:OmpH family outer membrane protein [Candidatus Aquilonibacter sp.]
MKIRFVVPVFAALTLASIAGAQAAARSAEAGSNKIAVIDFQGAIAGTAEGKADAAELQSEFAPRQTELTNISKQIDDIQTKLRAGQNTLSDEEKAHMQNEINELTQSGQRKQQDLQDDENAREQDLVQAIGSKMLPLVQKYAQENGYGVVLDGTAQQSIVVWAADSVNITQPIVSLYDSTYPVKAPGTAPSSTPRSTPSHPSSSPRQ